MNKTIDIAMAYLAVILIVLMVVGFAHNIFDAVETSLGVAVAVTGVAANAVWRN
jgi:uncharacterized protein (UPF0333 family)